MKRILMIGMLGVVAFGLACSGQARARKAYIKALIPELEKAMATKGFETEVTISKKGKVYDTRVDFKGLLKENEKWKKASHEEKLARFARVCAETMGFFLSGLQESGFIAFETLYIGYEDEVWSVSVEYAGYISSHAISRSKSARRLEKELMEEMERVE